MYTNFTLNKHQKKIWLKFFTLLLLFSCILFNPTDIYAQDTDNDGATDTFDVDDDNDGIKDENEMLCPEALPFGEIYVNTNNGGGLGELATYNVDNGTTTVLCGGTTLGGDIGIAPDGQIYIIEYSQTAPNLIRIDPNTCTETIIGSLPNGGNVIFPNALTFLPDGSALVGYSQQTSVYRVTLSPFSVTNWVTIAGYSPSGDFVIVDGMLYYFATNTGTFEQHVLEVSLDASYGYVSHTNLGTLPATAWGAALAENCQVIYGQNDRMAAITDITSGSLEETLITASVPSLGALWGFTSLGEATGCSTACVDIDTDNDGIPDRLDTDSDNDGCPDFVEGGSGFVESDGVPAAGTLTDGNGNGANQNLGNTIVVNGGDPCYGLPVVAGAGQAVGDAQDAGVQLACADPCTTGTDTDMDGVADDCDLDDDNDGILDVDEGCGFSGTTILNDMVLAGTATATGADEIQLTAAVSNQAGSTMSNIQIDMAQDFNLSFAINLGTLDAPGADGIAFIFHNDPAGALAVGSFGGGIGAQGIQNGIVIEFDTYVNTDFGDAFEAANSNDHTRVWDSDTGGLLPIPTPPDYLTPETLLGNIEDGLYHDVVINWDAAALTLTYSFDGTTIASITNDLVTNYFGGSNLVHFGVTGGTGTFFNDQRVRFESLEIPCTGQDTDNDGIADYLDLDSDNDGCPDAVEAGHTDPDDDGVLGTSPVSVDADGLVKDQGGYTGNTPATTDATISDSCCDIVLNTIQPIGESCPGSNDGSLIITAFCNACTNGVADIEYSIDGVNFQASSTFENLSPGGYTVTIRDSNNNACSAVSAVPIIVDPGPTLPDTDGDGIADCADTETCDGLDNNGDGQVDEGFPDTDSDGVADCIDTETCDGLDNDGDGEIDEDFPDTDGDGIADCLDFETCDGLDNDGDGLVDEGFPDTDGDGIADCVDVETCDGVDNDGDGEVDEAFPDTDGDGIADCTDIEICDGIDNDGDGEVDEGFVDTDMDGVPDDCDLDSDNDGILDVNEGCGFSGTTILEDLVLAGTATATGPDEVRLTEELIGEAGSAMSNIRIDMTQNFNLSFAVNLGSLNGNGADGIAFVFHNDPAGSSAVGSAGGGIGAQGIQDGIVVEFDTFGNGGFGDNFPNNYNDDHTSIWDSDTGSLSPETPPAYLTAETSLGNIEDGLYHDVVINWDATTMTLTYFFDGALIASVTNDLITNYFGGSNLVHFGITASTGALFNDQRVRFESLEIPCNGQDTDNDGIADYLDLDSDNDGCPDAIEAGHTDPDNDGVLGTSPVTVDLDGLVLGQGGYTGNTPATTDDTISDSCCDIAIADELTTDESCPGSNDGSITVTASCNSCTNGTADIEYSIDGTNFQSNNVFENLSPGNYTITIRDINDSSCSASSAVPVTINPGATLPDTDGDGIPDCADAETCDGLDNDGDGTIDEGFPDTDGDGTADCIDTETCDGFDNDGDGMVDEGFPDTDGDGILDCFDPDDDNDGIVDAGDTDPLNPFICQDIDFDGCDDCSIGTDGFGPLNDYNLLNDGLDTDGDGVCDSADVDDDNDGWGDNEDLDPLNPYICNDEDGDGCDDCSVGIDGFGVQADFDPNNDGTDTDGDGICDAGDADADNDGVLDVDDTDPLDPYVCQDLDGDGCDDCSVGVDGLGPEPDFDPFNDGPDFNGNGICDLADPACPDSLILAEVYGNGITELFEASENITATSLVKIGANIDYSAGVNINLLPGFGVKLGGEFHAYIEGCAPASVSETKNKLQLGAQEDNVQTVKFILSESADVKMELFNLVTGKVDAFSYARKSMEAGNHVQTIDLSELSRGVYVCKMIVNGEILTAKFFVE